MTIKVAILTNMLAPYRVPSFEALLNIDEIETVSVLVCVDKEADRDWAIPTSKHFNVIKMKGFTLNFIGAEGKRRFIHIKLEVFSVLRKLSPDIVIIGDASWSSYLGAFSCKILKIPYVWWNEILSQTPVSQGIIGKIRRAAIGAANATVAAGSEAKKFLIDQGVVGNKIYVALNSSSFVPDLLDSEEIEFIRNETRQKLGVRDATYVLLYVGQLIPRKRILELFEMLAQLRTVDCFIVVAGDGPLRQELVKIAADCSFERYWLTGFLAPAELRRFFYAADGLALISDDEPWGMVVNEALSFGKPVFSSTAVGAAADLIDEQSGIVTDASLVNLQCDFLEFLGRPFRHDDCVRRSKLASPSLWAEMVFKCIDETLERVKSNK